MASNRKVSVDEIRQHASPESCWIVVDGKVWDMTEFAPDHPGGAETILEHAGRDATEPYSAVHPPSLLPKNLPPNKFIGVLDTTTVDTEWTKPPPKATPELTLNQEKPPLQTIINANDFETVASKTFGAKTWAFYSSAATDCITRDANRSTFDRIWFRPRVLVNVDRADTRSRIMGNDVSMPLFVSPAALAGMAHPEGEKALARACKRNGMIQAVSTNASFPIDEIADAAPGHPFIFQLYVDRKRENSAKLLKMVEGLGVVKAVMFTVDAPVIGKREADERVRADLSVSSPMSKSKASEDKKGGGVGRTMGSYIDPTSTWETIAWLKKTTKLPIIVKGVQCAEDAKLCVKYGCQGIFVSNHGGRELDTAPAAIMVLLELQKNCPEVFEKLEVFVDGGIRRGTDILKCLCLGATAVGIGRSFLYSLNYGEDGVEHLIDILKDELETAMKLVGITDLSQVHPGLVNTLDVDHLIPTTVGHPYARWRPRARI
ncbi:putative mitochondrial cytochrome b2 [Rhizodiscina lignyota]|uniref:L-lactate dehydrogenase (cytochrome) n=1 Tax=Rhizodiscina lignyota TaxID=1504668 RepID=A0A9P4MCS3_9PEZI|nr:putative mitochondrial cytochrome b2 [Rhizodiscina lignyota]